ncbi:MAG: radical SAM protein [Polyangiaceae bacterium]|nr:radical SAM protein [Polyangiaceae bacterium]
MSAPDPSRTIEQIPRSPLPIAEERSAGSDDDLLFLFLVEDQVFLKLTRTCNNNCSFCCDTVFWNGTNMDPGRVRERIRQGAERGIKRLFLSGGEPTIHPDFIRFVKHARDLGYDQIVAITNGRMFSYEEFSRRSVKAGLTEVIFSLNSHQARTHDALVGVKGAFEQVVKGVEHVRRLGCPFRMNVVVTLKNYEEMPDMVRAFHAMGARSATFLQLVPTDRDWERSRHAIYYETELGRPFVRAALALAKELGFPIELKKFPDSFFEDFEEHIHDPLAWALEIGEIDWRRPDRHAPYKQGGAVKCWGERCSYCAYRAFCAHLMNHQEVRREARFDGFEIDAAELPPPLADALSRQPDAPVRICAPDGALAAARLAEHASRPRAVKLERPEALDRVPPDVAVVAASAADLGAAQAIPNPIEVELNAGTVAWLRAHPAWIRARGPRLAVLPATFLRLETARREQVDLRAVFEELPLGEAEVRGVPPCLSGRPEVSRAVHHATADLLRAVEDVPAHAARFYWQRFMTKSERCRGCRHDAACEGVHVNYVRHFGYRALRPRT